MNLKHIRKTNNLRQEDIANKLNIKQATYSGYESGKYEPSIDMLIKLSELFHTSIDNLIKGNENNTKPTKEYHEDLFNDLIELNEIECLKVKAYIEGLKAGKQEYEQEKILNRNKGN